MVPRRVAPGLDSQCVLPVVQADPLERSACWVVSRPLLALAPPKAGLVPEFFPVLLPISEKSTDSGIRAGHGSAPPEAPCTARLS